MNGWGVFSTLRIVEGVLFAFERHYSRMRRDAELLRVPFEHSAAQLQEMLLTLVEANHAVNATLRVAVVRNKGSLFESPSIRGDADIVAFTADLTRWAPGVKLGYMPNARFAASPFAGAKITSWAHNLTWYEKAHQLGLDEFILLNEFGQVSECTSANIFAVREDRVSTPPLASSGCLPGVTRAILLEEIKVPGLSIVEAELTPAELEGSEQVFISSTTRGLVPVVEIDGTRLSEDPVTLRNLQQEFTYNMEKYVGTHASPRREPLAV
jgi:branched-chain amino acid aminotransferase